MSKRLVKCDRCGQEVVRGVGARMHARECPGSKVKVIPPRIQIGK